jgi:hypothetical protein
MMSYNGLSARYKKGVKIQPILLFAPRYHMDIKILNKNPLPFWALLESDSLRQVRAKCVPLFQALPTTFVEVQRWVLFVALLTKRRLCIGVRIRVQFCWEQIMG